MINMINISPVLSTFCGKMLKTREMLIMLIMLIVFFQGFLAYCGVLE